MSKCISQQRTLWPGNGEIGLLYTNLYQVNLHHVFLMYNYFILCSWNIKMNKYNNCCIYFI